MVAFDIKNLISSHEVSSIEGRGFQNTKIEENFLEKVYRRRTCPTKMYYISFSLSHTYTRIHYLFNIQIINIMYIYARTSRVTLIIN